MKIKQSKTENICTLSTEKLWLPTPIASGKKIDANQGNVENAIDVVQNGLIVTKSLEFDY